MDANEEILSQAARDKRLPDDAFRLVVAALKGQSELDAVSAEIQLERRVRELLPERWGQAHAVTCQTLVDSLLIAFTNSADRASGQPVAARTNVDEFDAQMQGYVAQLASDRDVAVRAARNEDLSEVAQTRAQSQADALRWAVSYLHTWTRGRYGQPLAEQPDWRVRPDMASGENDEDAPLAGLVGVDEDGNATCW